MQGHAEGRKEKLCNRNNQGGEENHDPGNKSFLFLNFEKEKNKCPRQGRPNVVGGCQSFTDSSSRSAREEVGERWGSTQKPKYSQNVADSINICVYLP